MFTIRYIRNDCFHGYVEFENYSMNLCISQTLHVDLIMSLDDAWCSSHDWIISHGTSW